jgi:hypothetical protein
MVRRPLVAALIALVPLVLPASASATEPWVCMDYYEGVLTPVVGVDHDITALCSFDGDGHDLVKYEWDLDGDGSFETNTGTTPAVSHTWTDRGAFLDATVDVGLRITDSAGEVGEWSEPLRLIDTINGWFTFEPQLVNPGDIVELDAFITPDEIEDREWTYAWDLDGLPGFEHSTGLLPHATMVASDTIGPRAVGLEVTNDLGETSVIRRTIEVLPRHPSRDHLVYEAPKNLVNQPVLPPAPVGPGGPPLPAAPELTPVPATAAPKGRLKKVDADKFGLRLHYVNGPKWSRWKATVRIPAKRAAAYGLPRRAIVLARGTVVFDGRGIGRSNRMRWTNGAYRLFRQVRFSTIDILRKRVA